LALLLLTEFTRTSKTLRIIVYYLLQVLLIGNVKFFRA